MATEPQEYVRFLECPCCGDDGAEADAQGFFQDGQSLICGCPGWVSLDECEDDGSGEAWINNGDERCLKCDPPARRSPRGLTPGAETVKTCPDCGERVYSLGCTNCNEAAYIEEQEQLTERYGEDDAPICANGHRVYTVGCVSCVLLHKRATNV